VLCFAAGTEKAPGFYPCIGAILRSCGRPAQAQYFALGAAESLQLSYAKLGMSARAEALDGWREFINRLKAMGQPRPLIAIVAARPGNSTWSPLSERLAIAAYESLPEAPLVFAYTAERENGAMPEPQITTAAEEPKPAPGEAAPWPLLVETARSGGRVLTGMGQAAIVDAISALTRSIFPDDRIRSDRMANAFSASARREPIALEPGVLLLHAHAESLDKPTLALGSRAEGWPLAALSDPVRIMVILVSPENQGPEAHLEALTQIARAFKDKKLGDALLGGLL
jgi:mannitol/fructose-specific phosphotransferase system IIA component (Ntr-type)